MMDDYVARDGVSSLQFDEWEALMQSSCDGGMDIHLEKGIRKFFTGWAQPVSLFGLPAVHFGSSKVHLERAPHHVRLGPDDYGVMLQLAGNSVAFQNDRTVELAPGDLVLFDHARPARRMDDGRMLGVRLPRQLVVSHLGHEPQGGLSSRGTLAGRLIFQLATEAIKDNHPASAPGDAYMQLAICDLFCALIARPDNDLQSGSRHTEKLFAQVCSIIRDRFTDPDLTPSEVAGEAGISLRYLQKLFTPKGTTCIHFIHSLRLDHAARLLHRRALLGGKQPLSEIAFACGFRDYTFFSRKFRERFGCVPSTYAGGD
jgi:AraC-like DNA-binding protein